MAYDEIKSHVLNKKTKQHPVNHPEAKTVSVYHQPQIQPLRKDHLKLGERAAKKVTEFCGSWKFIIIILTYITIWITLNVYGFISRWDPWPFIILNLTLSSLAALQAPIILMGQKIVGDRDRLRFEYDYRIDRKTEREVQDMQKDLDEIKRMIKKAFPKKFRS